jgi:signal peptidase I
MMETTVIILEDSRYWGYVPENHIVGKPVFIWMSWDTNGKA